MVKRICNNYYKVVLLFSEKNIQNNINPISQKSMMKSDFHDTKQNLIKK